MTASEVVITMEVSDARLHTAVKPTALLEFAGTTGIMDSAKNATGKLNDMVPPGKMVFPGVNLRMTRTPVFIAYRSDGEMMKDKSEIGNAILLDSKSCDAIRSDDVRTETFETPRLCGWSVKPLIVTMKGSDGIVRPAVVMMT